MALLLFVVLALYCLRRRQPPSQSKPKAKVEPEYSTKVEPLAGSKVALNEPGKWKYFLSHKQDDCKCEAVMLANEWGQQKCWVDRLMYDKSVAAMEEGVMGSKVFVCILSDGYFKSEYCCKEMRWAFKYEKPIISTYKSGVKVGEVLNTAPDDFREQIMAIDSIPLNADDPDFFEVGIKKITKRLRALGQI